MRVEKAFTSCEISGTSGESTRLEMDVPCELEKNWCGWPDAGDVETEGELNVDLTKKSDGRVEQVVERASFDTKGFGDLDGNKETVGDDLETDVCVEIGETTFSDCVK